MPASVWSFLFFLFCEYTFSSGRFCSLPFPWTTSLAYWLRCPPQALKTPGVQFPLSPWGFFFGLSHLLTYAHCSQWSIGHQRPPAIALCSGLLLLFRTSWSPAVSGLLQCLASNCCEAGLSSSSPVGSRSRLGVWCWMLAS